MAVNPQKFLPQGKRGGALAPRPTGKITASNINGKDEEILKDAVLRVKTTTVQVEKLLAGSAALREKQRENERKAKEAAEAQGRESELEKPKDKNKFKIPKPKIVQSFWEKMKNFFLNTLLGWITVRLIPLIDKLTPVINGLLLVGNWLVTFTGHALNVLIKAIDLGYGLYDKARKWVGNKFGENGLKWFDKLSGAANTLINGFLIWKLVGERIFKFAIGVIKNAWNTARSIAQGVVNIGRNIGKGIGRIMHPRRTAEALKRVNNIKKIKKAKDLAKLRRAQRIKNIGRLRKVAKVKSAVGKGSGLLAKGVGKVGGLASKIFGKSAGAISGAFKGAQPFISKFFGRVPIVGPLVVGIVSLLSGEPGGQALFKTMGAALGGFLGTFIPIPILGTLLGETIGVFVGDLLYTLMFGGGKEAAGKKLKDTLTGLLKAGTAVKDWVTGGFDRFIETFREENKIRFGVTNWLNLLNPVITLPLLVKSFFPSGEEKGDKSPPASDDTMNKLKTVNDQSGAQGVIDSISTRASYEGVTPVPATVTSGSGGSSGEEMSEKALAITSNVLLATSGSSGEGDPYEKLYRGDG